MENVPAWALDDQELRKLIERCFPNPRQRAAAARMVRIVYLYYRTGFTAAQIGEQLQMSTRAVEESLRRINKTVSRPAKPRGRPKKETDAPDNL